MGHHHHCILALIALYIVAVVASEQQQKQQPDFDYLQVAVVRTANGYRLDAIVEPATLYPLIVGIGDAKGLPNDQLPGRSVHLEGPLLEGESVHIVLEDAVGREIGRYSRVPDTGTEPDDNNSAPAVVEKKAAQDGGGGEEAQTGALDVDLGAYVTPQYVYIALIMCFVCAPMAGIILSCIVKGGTRRRRAAMQEHRTGVQLAIDAGLLPMIE